MTQTLTPQALFIAAIELADTVARKELLDRECVDNQTLRQRVEDLLQAHYEEVSLGMDTPDFTGTKTVDIAPLDLTGTVVAGKYKLLERIGEGGMGVVWAAEQMEPVRRSVALKFLKAGMDSRTVVARFEAERQALALMDHPHIARVFDAGTTEAGQPYFVMEFVNGIPVTEFCDKRKLTVLQRLELFATICKAIQHAHQKGIIHRDIKPSNVLVSMDEELPNPKVIDFGVAKAIGMQLTEKSLHTAMGALVGTPIYMAPEQATFHQVDIDTRADVYALGVLIYELLVGSPPLEPASVKTQALDEVLRRVRDDDPPVPSARLTASETLAAIAEARQIEPGRLKKTVRGELDWIAMKALNKDRNRRYTTANAFALDVERFLNREPVSAVPPSRFYHIRKLYLRHRLLLTTAASVVGLLILATAVSVWQAIVAQNARQEAQKAIQGTQTLLVWMEIERGLKAAGSGDMASAALWFANAVTQAPHAPRLRESSQVLTRNYLNEVPIPVAVLDLSDFPLRHFSLQPFGQWLLMLGQKKLSLWHWSEERSLEWCDQLENVAAVAWSPDGSRIAIGFEGGKIRICDPETGTLLASLQHSEPVETLQWSPDCARLAVAGTTVKLWNVSVEAQPLVEQEWAHPRLVYSLVFDSEGSRLVTACFDDRIRVFDVSGDTQKTKPIFSPIEHAPFQGILKRRTAPVFFDSDKRIATITKERFLAVWDSKTGEALEAPTTYADLLASSGSSLAYSYERSCSVWDAASNASRDIKHGNTVQSLCFSEDGKMLLSTCLDGQARLSPISNDLQASSPQGFPQLVTGAQSAFASDGEHVAIAGQNKVIVWRMAENKYRAGSVDHWAEFGWLARPSFDGRLVAPGLWHESPFPRKDSCQKLVVGSLSSDQSPSPEIPLYGYLVDSCICADNRSVAAVCKFDRQGTFEIFDTTTGASQCTAVVLPSYPLSVAASPSQSQVAVLCANGQLQVFNANGGTLVCSLSNECANNTAGIARVIYSPDGNSLICLTSDNTISIWDTGTRTLRSKLTPVFCEGESICRALSISPDSRWIASGVCGENVVQVWDVNTGAAVGAPLRFQGDLYSVFSIDFSPKCDRLVTSHKDGKVRQWDWKSGNLIGSPMPHPDEVYSARYTSDGQYVVTSLRNSTIQIWDSQSSKPVSPPLTFPVPHQDNCCGAMSLSGLNVVASAPRHPIFDLSTLLEKPSTDIISLQLSIAELVSNQRLYEGELLPLTQAEWDERWQKVKNIASTFSVTPIKLAESLDRTSSVSERLAIARRALKLNLIGKVFDLRPSIPQVQMVMAEELERQGDDNAARKQRQLALDALQSALAHDTSNLNMIHQMVRIVLDTSPKIAWSTLEPGKLHSESGCTLKVQSDSSILAGSVANCRNDVYTIECNSPLRQIGVLRLEALRNFKIPGDGPGWGSGNFVLSDLEATVRRADGTNVPITFRSAVSDRLRPVDYDTTLWDGPWGAIDGDDSTRWDIWNRMGESHWLQLQFTEKISLEESDRVIIRLKFKSPFWENYRLGYFRLSATSDEIDLASQSLAAAVCDGSVTGLPALCAAYLAQGDAQQALKILKLIDAQKQTFTGNSELLLRARVQQLLKMPDDARNTMDQLLAAMKSELSPSQALPEPFVQTCILIAPDICGLTHKNLLDELSLASNKQWSNALEASSQLSVGAMELLGTFATQIGQWKSSAKSYLSVLENSNKAKLDCEKAYLWENAAATLTLVADEAAYQELCERLLKLQQETEDPDIIASLCLSCLMRSNVIDTNELRVECFNDEANRHPWVRVAQALVSYRDGKLEEALAWTEKTADGNPYPKAATACSLAIRALAQQQLAKFAEAEQTLQQVHAEIPVLIRKLEQTPSRRAPLPLVNGRWLFAECLRREAEALIATSEVH